MSISPFRIEEAILRAIALVPNVPWVQCSLGIEDTIGRDLKTELDFLKFFDAAVKSVMEIVDMPNQRAALLVRLIHQNNGKLSSAERQLFAELADDEMGKIEFAIKAAAETAAPEREL